MARIVIKDLTTGELGDEQLDTVAGGGLQLATISKYQFGFGVNPLVAGCGCMGMAQDPTSLIGPVLTKGTLAAGCGCTGMAQDPTSILGGFGGG